MSEVFCYRVRTEKELPGFPIKVMVLSVSTFRFFAEWRLDRFESHEVPLTERALASFRLVRQFSAEYALSAPSTAS
jgi:hypothetical protein